MRKSMEKRRADPKRNAEFEEYVCAPNCFFNAVLLISILFSYSQGYSDLGFSQISRAKGPAYTQEAMCDVSIRNILRKHKI